MVGPNPGAILMFQSTESDGTPPKFNIAPEKWWLEDYFPIGRQLLRGYVKLPGGIFTVLYQQDQQVQELFHQQDEEGPMQIHITYYILYIILI